MPEHPASVNIVITRRIGRIGIVSRRIGAATPLAPCKIFSAGYARDLLRTFLLALSPTLLHCNRQTLPAFGRQASALALLRFRFRCGGLGRPEALLATAWHDRTHESFYGSAEPVFFLRQICQ